MPGHKETESVGYVPPKPVTWPYNQMAPTQPVTFGMPNLQNPQPQAVPGSAWNTAPQNMNNFRPVTYPGVTNMFTGQVANAPAPMQKQMAPAPYIPAHEPYSGYNPPAPYGPPVPPSNPAMDQFYQTAKGYAQQNQGRKLAPTKTVQDFKNADAASWATFLNYFTQPTAPATGGGGNAGYGSSGGGGGGGGGGGYSGGALPIWYTDMVSWRI